MIERPRTVDPQKYLTDILAKEPQSLRAFVAKEALDYHGIDAFFSDILQYGCKSGLVTSLIYNHDIRAFFDRHYRDIERIRSDIEANLGESLTIAADLRSTLAYTAVEEVAFRMADEMGLLN